MYPPFMESVFVNCVCVSVLRDILSIGSVWRSLLCGVGRYREVDRPAVSQMFGSINTPFAPYWPQPKTQIVFLF